MRALLVFSGLLSSSTHGSSMLDREECSPNGALICHGEKQFGLCDNGKLVWQDVAPGTICRDNSIMPASLVTESLSLTVPSSPSKSTDTPTWTSPPPDQSKAPTISISFSTTESALPTHSSGLSSINLTSQHLTTSLSIRHSCPAVTPLFWNTSSTAVPTSISPTWSTVSIPGNTSILSPTQNVPISSSIELPSSGLNSNGSVTSTLSSNSSSYTSIEIPTSTDIITPSTSPTQSPTTSSEVVPMPSSSLTQISNSSISLSFSSAATPPIETSSVTGSLIDTETSVPTESTVFTESPAPTETPVETPEPTEAPPPTSRPISWWTSNTVMTLITVAPPRDPHHRV